MLRPAFGRVKKVYVTESIMRSSRSVVLLLSQCVAAASLFGCQPTPPPPPPQQPVIMPPTVQQAEQTQMEFSRTDPTVRVGRVMGITDMTAAVSGIPIDDLNVGDAVTFTDGKQVPIANGTVRMKSDTFNNYRFFIVDFIPSPNGGRAPINGDFCESRHPVHLRPSPLQPVKRQFAFQCAESCVLRGKAFYFVQGLPASAR